MKSLLVFLAALALTSSTSAQTQSRAQNLQLAGAGSNLLGGATLTLKGTATLTAESGAIVSFASASLTLPAWVPVLDTTLTPATNDVLVWNGTSSKWQRKTLTAGTGVTITPSSGALTISSSAGFSSQNANLVLAGPASGSASAPGFRSLVTADLPATGVTAGTYGSSSLIPVLTVDATGRVTVAGTSGIAGSAGGTVTSVAASVPTGFSISGSPVTASGTLAISYASGQTANRFLATPDGSTGALSMRALAVGDLPASGVSAGTYGSATQSPQITVDTAGRVTSVSNVTITGGGGGGGGGSGALVLLESHTASSSATLDFTAAISGTYDQYVIEFVNLVPATNAVTLLMRVSTNGGSTYDSSAVYAYDTWSWRSGGNAFGGTTGQTEMGLTTISLSNSATAGLSGSVTLYNPGSTTVYKQFLGQFRGVDGSAFRLVMQVGGSYESTTAIDALRFYFSSGNIASGTVRIYGVAH